MAMYLELPPQLARLPGLVVVDAGDGQVVEAEAVLPAVDLHARVVDAHAQLGGDLVGPQQVVHVEHHGLPGRHHRRLAIVVLLVLLGEGAVALQAGAGAVAVVGANAERVLGLGVLFGGANYDVKESWALEKNEPSLVLRLRRGRVGPRPRG